MPLYDTIDLLVEYADNFVYFFIKFEVGLLLLLSLSACLILLLALLIHFLAMIWTPATYSVFMVRARRSFAS